MIKTDALKQCVSPGGKNYSFTLPAEILLMMYFEKKQKAMIIGITEIATPK